MYVVAAHSSRGICGVRSADCRRRLRRRYQSKPNDKRVNRLKNELVEIYGVIHNIVIESLAVIKSRQVVEGHRKILMERKQMKWYRSGVEQIKGIGRNLESCQFERSLAFANRESPFG